MSSDSFAAPSVTTAQRQFLNYDLTKTDFGCIRFPYQSASSTPTCDQSCQTCSQQYRSLHQQKSKDELGYEQILSNADAALVAGDLTRDVKENLENVKSKLQVFGDAMAKRWTKKNTKQRIALLLKAKPDICQQEWHRIEPNQQRDLWAQHQSQQDDNRRLLPQLHLPTLSKKSNLLSLLHLRTAYAPASWASYDCEQLRQGFEDGKLELAYNPHSISLAAGDSYGTLVPWNIDGAHQWSAVGFPRAILVFQA